MPGRLTNWWRRTRRTILLEAAALCKQTYYDLQRTNNPHARTFKSLMEMLEQKANEHRPTVGTCELCHADDKLLDDGLCQTCHELFGTGPFDADVP